MGSAVTTYRSRCGRLTLQLPEGWAALDGVDPTLELVALEPDNERGFRANLVLTIADIGMSLGDWQEGVEQLLPEQLEDYVVLDLERLTFAGHPGGRRLACHVSTEHGSLTMGQWFTVVGGTAVTLTLTCHTFEYPHQRHLWEALAAGATWGPTS